MIFQAPAPDSPSAPTQDTLSQLLQDCDIVPQHAAHEVNKVSSVVTDDIQDNQVPVENNMEHVVSQMPAYYVSQNQGTAIEATSMECMFAQLPTYSIVTNEGTNTTHDLTIDPTTFCSLW